MRSSDRPSPGFIVFLIVVLAAAMGLVTYCAPERVSDDVVEVLK